MASIEPKWMGKWTDARKIENQAEKQVEQLFEDSTWTAVSDGAGVAGQGSAVTKVA